MKRRNFLKSTTASALLANTSLNQSKLTNMIKDNPKLLFFQTNWGYEGNVDSFCAAAKKEGYDGIELWWPGTISEQNELALALKKHSLKIGFLCGDGNKNPIENLKSFKQQIDAATSWSIKPIYINCHAGKDYFSTEDNQKFIDYTSEVAKKSNINIYHETHRGKILFAAHITKQFLDKNPSLRLTLDISHWCNVHESLLEDQKENVEAALLKTEHIHARVGHEEGPQVNDPRAPEWKRSFDAHLAWWDKVVALKTAKDETITILTEFGPPSYLQTLPFTNMPVADQWGINVFMMKFLKERYTKK